LRNEDLFASLAAVPPPLTNISLNEGSPTLLESDVPLNNDHKEVGFGKSYWVQGIVI